MGTRDSIVELADLLIRDKGYNAFSFADIAKNLKVKNASIHYHFATKADLGVAVIQKHIIGLEKLILRTKEKNPEAKLKAFFSIYDTAQTEGTVCLVGSLATTFTTLDSKIKRELKKLGDNILTWVTEILEEGKTKKVFAFDERSRTKALMVIASMLAGVQVSRITTEEDFITIKEAVMREIKK